MHLQIGCQRMLGGELTEVLHQVEGEAVVVVDDQQHLRIGSQEPQAEQERRKQEKQSDQQGADGGRQHGGSSTVFGDAGQG